jgi:hypothetical protein
MNCHINQKCETYELYPAALVAVKLTTETVLENHTMDKGQDDGMAYVSEDFVPVHHWR